MGFNISHWQLATKPYWSSQRGNHDSQHWSSLRGPPSHCKRSPGISAHNATRITQPKMASCNRLRHCLSLYRDSYDRNPVWAGTSILRSGDWANNSPDAGTRLCRRSLCTVLAYFRENLFTVEVRHAILVFLGIGTYKCRTCRSFLWPSSGRPDLLDRKNGPVLGWSLFLESCLNHILRLSE